MERVTETLLAALKQALAAGVEQRLYRSGKLDGLFPGRTGSAAEAAALALREELLERTRIEIKGKTEISWVRLTPRGVEWLHQHESPVVALHELRAALRAGSDHAPRWITEMQATLEALAERLTAEAQKQQQRLDALTRRVEVTLRRLEDAAPPLPRDVLEAHPWAIDAVNYLDRRRNGGATSDCPLPELYEAVRKDPGGPGLGAFHEGLRRLYERKAVTLRPAASLAELPQPEFALFDKGTVLYYATR
jgi:hypothetical protein